MAKKILVIDDDTDILEILDIVFKQEGYEVVLSETGDEADQIQQIHPDIVLLDLQLRVSGRNGADICAKIKGNAQTMDIPVILISSEDNIEQISEKCGANAYISKPFKMSHLLWNVNKILAA
jgi:DNA-binding response OmpR family regulator